MEEKEIIKGMFSKTNIVTILFCFLAIISFFVGSYFFTSHGESPALAITFPIPAILLACFFHYLFDKCAIVVTDKRVYGKAAFGKAVSLPFDMISAVGVGAFNQIAVATSSGRIKFYLCSNKEEVYNAISNMLNERQGKTNKSETVIKQETSNADELKKYKDLLDSGVITREEFEQKKKQLLGL